MNNNENQVTEIQVFNNVEFGKLRGMYINEEPWLVGRDVAEALGYSNASKAIIAHVDNEDKLFRMVNIADSQNGNVPIGQTKTAFINESGFYSLVFSSNLPTAKKFKRWVTSEVLPSIRKTGSYSIGQGKEEESSNVDMERSTADLTVDEFDHRLKKIVAVIKAMDSVNHITGSRKISLFKEMSHDLVKSIGTEIPTDVDDKSFNLAECLLDYFNIHITPESFFSMLYQKGWAPKSVKIYPISPDSCVYACELKDEGVKYGVNYWYSDGKCFVAMFRNSMFQELCLDLALDTKLNMEALLQ